MFKTIDNTILDICNYEYDFFLNKKNVVGIGLGFKIRNGIRTYEKSVLVFVEKKVSSNLLEPKDIIPCKYKSINTDVIESGLLYTTSLKQRVRPVIGGYSIAPTGFFSAGTYGGLVTNGNSLFMLSNNHVLALNQLPIGQPILQPGPYDGGVSPRDMVARLFEFIPIGLITPISRPENFVDCAIAELISPDIASSEIYSIGKPKGITTPTLNLNIQMAGKTSEYLSGSIIAIGITLTVNIPPLGQALFKNQFITGFSVKSGDSGSLILTFDKKVVGLQMAGGNDFCVCNNINSVLTALNVNLVTE